MIEGYICIPLGGRFCLHVRANDRYVLMCEGCILSCIIWMREIDRQRERKRACTSLGRSTTYAWMHASTRPAGEWVFAGQEEQTNSASGGARSLHSIRVHAFDTEWVAVAIVRHTFFQLFSVLTPV